MTFSIRPTEVPELRAEIAEAIRSRPDDSNWERVIADGYTPFRKAAKVPSAAQHAQMEEARIREAELFYVSADMTELAKVAAASLPAFLIQPQDLPAPHGFMVFAEPIEIIDFGTPDVPSPVVGACWMTLPVGGTSAVWLSFYSTREACLEGAALAGMSEASIEFNRRRLPRLTPMIGVDCMWPFDACNGEISDNASAEGFARACLSIRATWLLMQQPLTTTPTVTADRAAQKRLARAGHEPAPVRVIELRRRQTAGSHGTSDRTYHHQWITRGHWRQQWYPTREVHRPVWIAPHIKGPEGAPLLGGEKVYALKR